MNRLLYRQLVPVLCHSHSNDHSKVLTPWQEGKRAENCFLEKYPQSVSHTSSENREVWLSHLFFWWKVVLVSWFATTTFPDLEHIWKDIKQVSKQMPEVIYDKNLQVHLPLGNNVLYAHGLQQRSLLPGQGHCTIWALWLTQDNSGITAELRVPSAYSFV